MRVLYRSPTASLQAIPQATGLALPPTLDNNDPNSPPNPQRALNIAVQAISSGINQAISTVQNSNGQMGGPPLSPGPAPALSPAGSPIAAFPGSQGASTAPQSTGSSGPNTGAIVGGQLALLSFSSVWPVGHKPPGQCMTVLSMVQMRSCFSSMAYDDLVVLPEGSAITFLSIPCGQHEMQARDASKRQWLAALMPTLKLMVRYACRGGWRSGRAECDSGIGDVAGDAEAADQ